MIKDLWDYIYGSKSHLNLAGKILIGIPMAPFLLAFVLTFVALETLFTKRDAG